jgi:prolipoprotein diacylglyceryltransferase
MLLENLIAILAGIFFTFLHRFSIKLKIPIPIIIFSLFAGGMLIIGGILGFIYGVGPFQTYIDYFSTEPLEPIDYYWR